MGRSFIRWMGFSVAVLLVTAAQPSARGGERKSGVSARDDRGSADTFVFEQARRAPDENDSRRAKVDLHGSLASMPVSSLETRAAHAAERADRKERTPADPNVRKKITLFRLDPKYGDVSVQPVLGQVNGAQCSVGF